jgi:hypothetical protein
MTEQEWLECADPNKMLGFLHGKASDRKLRLFAWACCRNASIGLSDELGPMMVDVAERFSDNQASREELVVAWNAGMDAYYDSESRDLFPRTRPALDSDGGCRARCRA